MRILVLLWCSGCVIYNDSMHVTVRDLAAVTATIRPDDPSYATSWIARDEHDAFDMWCPACGWIKRRTIEATNHTLVLDGTPELVTREGDHVHLRFDYEDHYYCHRRHGCERRAFAVVLDTPRSNVAAITYEHRVSPSNGEGTGRSLYAFAAFYATAGALLAGFAAYKHSGPVIGVGAAMMAIGAGVAGFGYHLDNASDTITSISP